MKNIDETGVTFVNTVLGRGVLNGVVNLTFGTLLFTPENDRIEPDMVVSSRLRMDELCARRLFEALAELITSIDKEKTGGGLVPGEAALEGAEAKPN